ncbi:MULTISPECIES: Lrp/AsnC family transcriptional regulator [Acidiplasma]|jgi:DNA-binding Lrp family transcriptional regulator|uniref:HTH asnC-type domain-containing protein n=2 Tax=Acidiplasma TaxID=507753 RepID=A0A0Q0RVT3_9ARCH|nr:MULTISPECIES: Lrp/AsnC family transcriptional regulator [Acidiplasma]KJE49223.1 hypothetical protein TZ01_03905 [Acidiplasma sp. MBA-1]KPV47395.1 hypothetical protein SE19_01245 [Acidiplasma aeolicum]KQB33888.1 hypothetical protein AOG54_06265 [Acidiplasma aeolicum]KQB36490.1 hypothetical protein AOG55_03955 [Acidiplasma cupricumulans]WMT54812.1 MAG: Lrp/AsnC family transcriptional regulator [Acidiplasma sp.]
MDEKDKEILKTMMILKTNNLQDIADRVSISKSSVQKRIKKMEEEKIIKGFIPELDRNNLPETLTAISMIKARYGPGYAEEVGEKIKEVKGICALYYVLGDYDFTAVIKAESIKDLESILNKISLIDGVERSNTITVLSIKKEDLTEFNRID